MLVAILKGFAQVLLVVLKCLKIPFFCCILLIAVLIMQIVLFYCYFVWIKKMKPTKALNNERIKKHGFFYKILIAAPRQFAYDIITRPEYFFSPQGLVIYEGRQGSGKTSTMVHDIYTLQKKHPFAECMTNFKYKWQDDELLHWKQIIDYKNRTDKYAGIIIAIDELQNWFSSKDSKNFDPQMLGVVTQNRKNRRLICGTAQQFYMLSKDIRTQCTEVRHCTTFLGCITLVHRKIPIVDSAGDVVEWKSRGFYFWVHNNEIRNSYDTWLAIENLKKAGFIRRDEVTVKTS